MVPEHVNPSTKQELLLLSKTPIAGVKWVLVKAEEQAGLHVSHSLSCALTRQHVLNHLGEPPLLFKV